MLHSIDASTQYSPSTTTTNSGIETAIEVLDFYWISLFWALTLIQLDQAFDKNDYKQFFFPYDIIAIPILGRCHNRNVMESKDKFF